MLVSLFARLELTAKEITENDCYKKIHANPEGMDRLLRQIAFRNLMSSRPLRSGSTCMLVTNRHMVASRCASFIVTTGPLWKSRDRLFIHAAKGFPS
jgi:hypothetical protein